MLVLAIILAGAAPDEPAIAESPMRVFRVSMIEANAVMDANGDPRLVQWIWWDVSFDQHSRTTHLIDRGWKKIEEGVLTGEPGKWAVEYGDVRIEAPVLFESVTDVDAEMEYRTGSNVIW
jgi:hypothetical protein